LFTFAIEFQQAKIQQSIMAFTAQNKPKPVAAVAPHRLVLIQTELMFNLCPYSTDSTLENLDFLQFVNQSQASKNPLSRLYLRVRSVVGWINFSSCSSDRASDIFSLNRYLLFWTKDCQRNLQTLIY